MTLQPLDVLNGSLSLASLVLAVFICSHMILKYFEYKRRTFLLVGISGFLMTEPWWPAAISFIVALITGKGLPPTIYFIIGNVGVPVAIVLWLIAFTDFMEMEGTKKYVLIGGMIIYGIIFEIIFFYLLFLDPSLIGELQGPIDVEYRYFVMIYLFSLVVVVLITGIIFAKESMKSDSPEMKLRGKLILIAFISWSFGAILDTAVPLTSLTLIIIRIILISSAIEFWGGFILPNWMKKLFIKDIE